MSSLAKQVFISRYINTDSLSGCTTQAERVNDRANELHYTSTGVCTQAFEIDVICVAFSTQAGKSHDSSYISAAFLSVVTQVLCFGVCWLHDGRHGGCQEESHFWGRFEYSESR